MSGGPGSGAELVELVVADLLARFRDQAEPALADEYDAIHRWRTTTRRLRTVVSAFRADLAKRPGRDLRADLAELGGLLGEPRDLEVRIADLERLGSEAGVPAEDLVPLVEPLRIEHAGAHALLVARWRAGVGRALEERVDDWSRRVPLRAGRAEESAKRTARTVLAAQAEQAARLARRVRRGEEEYQHELRKACRRVRHVGEAVTRPPADVLGAKAARLVVAGRRLQSVLGDQRDAELLAAHLDGAPGVATEVRGALLGVCRDERARALQKRSDALAELRASYRNWR